MIIFFSRDVVAPRAVSFEQTTRRKLFDEKQASRYLLWNGGEVQLQKCLPGWLQHDCGEGPNCIPANNFRLYNLLQSTPSSGLSVRVCRMGSGAAELWPSIILTGRPILWGSNRGKAHVYIEGCGGYMGYYHWGTVNVCCNFVDVYSSQQLGRRMKKA